MAGLLKSTLNTRQLINGSYKYIRSDAPFRLTEDEEAFLLGKNITTLVDLRTTEESERKPVSLRNSGSFTYLQMPVTGGSSVPDSVDLVSGSYIRMVDEQMKKIISYIENAPSNVLFFCNAGKDRTGVVSAVLLKRLGYTNDEIIDDYMETAENLGSVLKSYAEAEGIDVNIITPQRRYIEEFLLSPNIQHILSK